MKYTDKELNASNAFSPRHIGPDDAETRKMLDAVGCDSMDQLMAETIPAHIRMDVALDMKAGIGEQEFLDGLTNIAAKNKLFKSYIGLGYYDCIVPGVILRNVFENPGWYTAYTPYQAEIAQGRLEALLNFQTVVSDLTAMDIANASLLDEGTAAAEAMVMLHRSRTRIAKKNDANTFFVSGKCLPQTIDVLKTRSAPLGIELRIGDWQTSAIDEEIFGVLLQYPDVDGAINDYTAFIEKAHEAGALVAVAADLLSLTLLTPPGEMGADVVVGSAQRFGVPMGYGGPHAAFFATREDFKRQVPGRIIGVSQDRNGNNGYRMALQTREQHIRREKATSNICTAQTLLANMASMYAVYHGAEGLKTIATRVHVYSAILAEELAQLGCRQNNAYFFDTLNISLPAGVSAGDLHNAARENEMNFREIDAATVGISLDETTTANDLDDIIGVFAKFLGKSSNAVVIDKYDIPAYPANLTRSSEYLTHPVFSAYRTETEMLRYIKSLENKDLSLTHSMIPLGSCTMKLNASTELVPVSWPAFSSLHPFVPEDQVAGYQQIFDELEAQLCQLTGFAAVSLQPNSGAQGEYAGMLVIKQYHEDRGEGHRNIALIPSSAHGTNPASAIMAGMKVVVVKCDDLGNIDLEDLRAKAAEHKDDLAALMVTYPSTHGVFEEGIREICKIVHANGGQVYMDGANMNAQVGLTSPALIGADVCHLNLHKTFSIPHGGGGPGMGPIGVAKHLAPYLPGHVFGKNPHKKNIAAISAARYGSASILLISYAYIKMLGGDGLTDATRYAILNANYIKSRLEGYYPVLYTGTKGRNAHEMIFDCRPFKQSANIEVEDIAKRLMDYGFHAPTVSFPVAGTIMVEPTESESLEELDRFCEAMVAIYNEIQEIASGIADPVDNVLKNAPHTVAEISADEWPHTYSREKAAYPLPFLRTNKFWPASARIDNAYGDRNLICSCPPLTDYVDAE